MEECLRDVINAVREDAIDYFINSDELPEVGKRKSKIIV